MARIVVIDDDASVRTFLRIALERAGHEVTEAATGAEGIRECTRRAPDVVVCDLFMPARDGFETILALRARSRVRVLAITGCPFWHEIDMLSIANALGADACLAKPFSVDALTDAVARLLEDRPLGSWSESLADGLPPHPVALSGSGAWIRPRSAGAGA